MKIKFVRVTLTTICYHTWKYTSSRPSNVYTKQRHGANRLVGLVVKASASRAEDPGFESRLRRDFSGVESYQWLKILALQWLLGAWRRYRVSAGTGWPGVSMLWWKVGSATSISVWQHVKLSEQTRSWDTLACCWDVKQPTNNNSHGAKPHPAEWLAGSVNSVPRCLSAWGIYTLAWAGWSSVRHQQLDKGTELPSAMTC